MPEPITRGQRYMPGLDGLRALAVAAVVFYHLGFGWAGGGLLGVGVFFTLSGYLITDILLAQLSGRGIRLGKFWLGRARRLLPALLAMLAVVSLWVATLGPAQHQFGEVVTAAVLYVSNWQLIFQHVSYFARFGPPTPLNHLWSLGIEEQFYILWPLLLILGVRLVPERSRVGGTRPRLALLTLLLAAASAVEMGLLYHPSFDSSRIYFGTDTRAFELLGGAALAMAWPSRLLRKNVTSGARRACDGLGVIGLVGIGVLIWTTNQYSAFLYQGGFVLLTVATVLVIAAAVHPAGSFGPALGILPLRWIGVRSYGIYLWHMPIIALTTPAGTHTVDLWRSTLQVAATILVAALSWRYLEEPIRHGALARAWQRWRSGERPVRGLRRRRLGPAALVQLGAVAALVVIVAVLTAAGNGGGNPTAAPLVPTPLIPTPAVTTVAVPVVHKRLATGNPARSSCRAVIDIGDSTSEGLTSSEYLPDRANRIEARFDDVGATIQHYSFSGARSIVETYDGQTNAVTVAQAWKRVHYRGCWVLALGTNDAANVYVGSSIDPFTRIEQMMSTIGRQPVMWVNVKSLLTTGPYSEQNMQGWNAALLRACQDYPNMRVFDWSSVVQSSWFIEDGIHYNTPGYRARARTIAEALGKAFPSGGHSAGCVVK
jgi:peptidoglycan/LPS O-acetylase OafA/YrhL/lysophospholipase L1-like esterase